MLLRYLILISSIFIITSNSLFSEENLNEIQYTITPLFEEKKLEIELVFQGNDRNYTEIEIPISWTGQPFEEIVNLTFSSKEEKLTVDYHSSPNSIRIFHKPYEQITVRYNVIQLSEKSDIHSASAQDPTFFRFTGDSALIIPKWDLYKKRTICLNWKGLPFGWSVANSFGIHETTQRLTISLFALHLGLYIGGEIHVVRCGDAENAPYIATKDVELFSSNRLILLLQTIIQSQRDFWNDEDFSHFLIVIIPSDSEQGMHAEAKLNAFIVFSPSLFDMDEEEWKSLTWVLSHEHFHTWNPFKMLPNLPENFERLAWFTEGFTEYYTAVLSHRAQTLDFAYCIKEINRLLYSYYTSPFQNAKNDYFQEERWNDIRMQLLAYQRGCLLALLWDSKIQQRTAGVYSLDDVMRALLQKVRETDKPILVTDIEELIGKYLGEEATLDLHNYIVEGQTIVPPNHILGSALEILWMEDVGFNLYYAQENGVVTGVVEDSHAYRGGLRNGQEFKELLHLEGSVCVVIKDPSGIHKISYPSNASHLIPQYKIPSKLIREEV